MNKNLLYISIAVIAAFLVVYGSFLLLSPAYRDKLKNRPMNKKKRNPVLTKIGGFDLEPGEGMSLEESGQKFSHFAPGQNPNLKGHYNTDVQESADPKGEADFFDMFMQ